MSDIRTWYILLHRRGLAVPAGQRVFDHPGISEHYAFLKHRLAEGSLIAAGPLTDADGEGMTILAVESLDEARRLAEQEDRSVVDGVLTVEVRPWHVVMAPLADR